MNHPDPDKFLHSLATYLADECDLTYGAGASRNLWIWQAVEATAGAGVGAVMPYSVLTTFGGPAQAWDAQPRCSIQCRTVGSSAAAMSRAAALFAALHDADGYPGTMLQIPALTRVGGDDGTYTIVSVEPAGRPGVVSMEAQRADVIFNFDLGFFWEPA